MPFDFPVPRQLVDLTIGSAPITPGSTAARLYDATLGAVSVANVFGLSISGVPSSLTVGLPFVFVPSVAGGAPPYAGFILTGTLPAGLSFSSTTGAITGTPTTAGTTSGLSITATDSKGVTATLGPFALVVTGASGGVSYLVDRDGSRLTDIDGSYLKDAA